MWELDCEESWGLKNWCFWTVVLEKTLESPLDYKEIQPVHSKGDQSWVFFGKNDTKAETPVLWPPHAKSWLIGKDSDAGRDWGQEEKGTTEDEMAGWHHWLDGCESEWTPGVGDGQGRPGVLQFMGSQRVGHDWATELNWILAMEIEGWWKHIRNSIPSAQISVKIKMALKNKTYQVFKWFFLTFPVLSFIKISCSKYRSMLSYIPITWNNLYALPETCNL